MEFYVTPSFFILLAIFGIPAVLLGLLERPLRHYGLAVSVVLLFLLFSHDPAQLGAFAFFLLVASVLTYGMMREWTRGRQRLWLFRLSLASMLIPLVLTKFGAVFDQNFLGFLGISYITFKALQVLIEIRDKLIVKLSPFDYLYFLLFFAPFTSGPIDRSRRFREDAQRVWSRKEYADMLTKGVLFLLVGAVYKIVFASVAFGEFTPETLGANPSVLSLLAAGKDAYAYGLYLFFDFAGYSLMAVGAGYCFGIVTPMNFRAPFRSIDIKDFWNRWHITLSFWLRDFVFMRFTRFATKHKIFSSRLTTACCGYLINMGLMGAWHGLTVDYLVYGLYHGLLLALTDVWQKKSRLYKRYGKTKPYKLASWALTVQLVMFGFALFSGQVHTIVGGLLYGY